MSSDRRTFEKYQSQTQDAWDIDEDDDNDFIQMSHDIRMSKKDVKRTAIQVMNKHYEQSSLAQTHSPQATPTKGAAPRTATVAPPASSESKHHATSTPSSANNAAAPSHHVATKPVDSQKHQRGRESGPGLGVRLQGQRSGLNQSALSRDNLTPEQVARLDKFSTLLSSTAYDIEEIRKQSWSGIPSSCRPIAWKILSGLVPPILEKRDSTLQRKRDEYQHFVNQYFHTRTQAINEECFRQIHIDVPRMSPLITLFHQDKVQEIFERILFIWAIRHPASGYVQGINDLVTPFFVVFLTEYIPIDGDIESFPVADLSPKDLQSLEADCFWCFSKLLDGIQNNYTFAQPGIQEKVNSLKSLVNRIDGGLNQHLLNHNIEYLQFAFRWMNNLLMREIPLHCIIRLWDTYLAEKDGFANFHLYVCASFLTKFSAQIRSEVDFQGLMMLLQCLPTQHWSEFNISEMLAEAYKLQFMFADAPKHTNK